MLVVFSLLSVASLSSVTFLLAGPGASHPPVQWEQFSAPVRPRNAPLIGLSGRVRLVEEKLFYPTAQSDDLRLSSTEEYEFNDSGYVVRQEVTQGILVGSKELYFFEEGTHWLLQKSYNRHEGSNCTDSIVCRYDTQGKLLEKAHYYPYQGWRLLDTERFVYDAQGRLKGEFSVDSKRDTTRWRRLEYDAQGNQVRETNRQIGGALPSMDNSDSWTRHDAQGRELKDSTLWGDGDRSVSLYEYNEQGFHSQHRFTSFDENGTYAVTTTLRYKFDAAGNWVEKSEYKRGALDRKMVRKIEYY
jgi:hypothetical protein